MGEIQYYVTMSVTTEQEQAIRIMFKSYNWTCSMNVLSEDRITALIDHNFIDIFPKTIKEEPPDMQIKIEVNADGSDTESASLGSDTESATDSSLIDEAADSSRTGKSEDSAGCKRTESENMYQDSEKVIHVGVEQSETHRTQGNTSADFSDVTDKVIRGDQSNQRLYKEQLKSKVLSKLQCANLSSASSDELKGKDMLNIFNAIINLSNANKTAVNSKTDGRQNHATAETSTDHATQQKTEVTYPGLQNVLVVGQPNTVEDLNISPDLEKHNKKEVIPPVSQNVAMLGTAYGLQITDVLKQVAQQVGVKGEPYVTNINGETKMYILQGPFPVTGVPGGNVTPAKQPKPKFKPPKFPFKCARCPQMFVRFEELYQHLQEEDKELARKQKEKEKYEKEMKEKGCLQCAECGKYFVSKRKLSQHHYGSHRDLMPAFECGTCNMVFATRTDLWKHKKINKHADCHSSKDTFLCERCGKILQRYTSFWEHTKRRCGEIEEQEPTIPCEKCGVLFKHMAAVKSHMKRVHQFSPEICDVCGKEFQNKIKLSGHRHVHIYTERKFDCPNCDKSFTKRNVLEQHMRTHTKEKPFKCPKCDYVCAVKGNINKHSVKVHKEFLRAIDLRKVQSSDQDDWQSYNNTNVGQSFNNNVQVAQSNKTNVPVSQSSENSVQVSLSNNTNVQVGQSNNTNVQVSQSNNTNVQVSQSNNTNVSLTYNSNVQVDQSYNNVQVGQSYHNSAQVGDYQYPMDTS